MDYRNPLHTCRLLRLGRERPHGDPAAEQRHELAASDESCHLILQPEGCGQR